MAEERYYATGKRKRSVARVWMAPGTGQITINKRPFEKYLVRESDRILAVEPLKLAELLEKYDLVTCPFCTFHVTFLPRKILAKGHTIYYLNI